MKPGLLAIILLAGMAAGPAALAEVRIRAVFDEADAALEIMERLHEGQPVTGRHWDALWQSEGYTRLLAREASMGRDAGFGDKLAAWLQDPANYERVEQWRNAVAGYRSFDANAAGNRAARYLSSDVVLRASFYPVIKHTANTFVFELDSNPAIFMTVNPDDSPLFVESVLAHELHHVGFAQCPEVNDYAELSESQQQVTGMLGVFGEGLAVLATAGGPMTHPHYYSTPGEWAGWERDVVNAPEDLLRMQEFFLGVLSGTVADADRRPTLFTFIATEDVPQGPAYTLGWKMFSLIERYFGRDVLVENACDPRELLKGYNAAATATVAGLPLWSEDFIRLLYPGAE